MTTSIYAETAKTQSDDKILATVDGRTITSKTLSQYEKRRGMPHDGDPQQQRQAMLEELINRELIYLDALKQGLDKKPAVVSEIENQRVNIVASAMLQEISTKQSVSEADMKKEYDNFVSTMKGQEFKASHILVENEDTAKQIIADLDKGGDFKELAKQKSTGPSGPNGGDLGWFKPESMVKPFSDAVLNLKNGKYTKKPVKTQFGWHVILREADRDVAPPLYDSLKEQIRMSLQNKTIEAYIASLRKSAKIDRQQ